MNLCHIPPIIVHRALAAGDGGDGTWRKIISDLVCMECISQYLIWCQSQFEFDWLSISMRLVITNQVIRGPQYLLGHISNWLNRDNFWRKGENCPPSVPWWLVSVQYSDVHRDCIAGPGRPRLGPGCDCLLENRPRQVQAGAAGREKILINFWKKVNQTKLDSINQREPICIPNEWKAN